MHLALLWNSRDMERYLILSYLGYTSFPFCLFEQSGKNGDPHDKQYYFKKFAQIKISSLEFLTENYFHL